MFSFLQHKAVVLLVILVVVGAVIGVLNNLALKAGRPFFVHDIMRSIIAPSEIIFHTTFAAGERAVRAVRPRAALLKENASLRIEVLRLTQENARLREAALEGVRLRRALELRDSSPARMIAAELISRNASSWFDTATINRGRSSGVELGGAVVTQRGLVGQVLQVDPFTSQVVALTHRRSAVGAMVQRSRSSGILQGQGADLLVLSHLPKDADVKTSDIVISSGTGRVVPKGFMIGRVVKVVREPAAGTTSALVRPSVRFDEIEQVFVVKLDKH